ncbi:unnamed protein product [Kluyveromyces dobzhanskii CBS 2104]|uniref:U2 small nuclear ribonucleoprotein A' n=1 Tax=Kluyveromyces dobzhanskii CBS 2104 TaxID=1427455 RepID=A0A0A8KZT8_9SACH|nr:unnamed protein product [Kluyveromyces dobzhanskii CBS 2104]
MPKLGISQVLDAPSYLVDHFDGGYDTDKVVILRDASIISDTTMLKQSLSKLPADCKVLDLTNNDLVTVPPLSSHRSIHTLLLGRNRIKKLDGIWLPTNISKLSLVQNEISELSDLDGLQMAPKSLRNVCLRGNDVCYLAGYRRYVLAKCPQLEVLDFERVTKKDRVQGASANVPVVAMENASSVAVQTSDASGEWKRDKHMELLGTVVKKMDEATKNEIKEQLANATTLDEIERLESLLAGNLE